MKKMIAMLLVVILCFGLVACGGSGETPEANGLGEMAIVGTWDNNGNKMIFEADHTGTVSDASTGMKFEADWTFNADDCSWTIEYAGSYSTTVTITESDGTYVMKWNQTLYTLDTE